METGKSGGFNLRQSETDTLKSNREDSEIGYTGVLTSEAVHTGETGVLQGSIPPNVYGTTFHDEPVAKKSSSGGAIIAVVAIVVVLVVVAIVLKVAGVF